MADADIDPDTRIIIILNTDSGDHVEGASAEEIEKLFADRGHKASVQPISAGADIAEIVAKASGPGVTCVVAAGGDGTICGVVDALVGTDMELGVIPLGTFNYFARSFDIPQEVAPAIDIICAGQSRPINVGSVNGTIFLNNASLGLYAAILSRREGIYRRWGRSRLAAYWSVLSAMATVYRPLTMQVSINGKHMRATSPMIFVAASAYQLDEFEIEGAQAIRNGEFAVLLAPNCGRVMLLWKAMLIAFRGVQKDRDFTLLTGDHVVVETRRPSALVARDGERETMKGPFEFRLMQDAIRLRVPQQVATDPAP